MDRIKRFWGLFLVFALAVATAGSIVVGCWHALGLEFPDFDLGIFQKAALASSTIPLTPALTERDRELLIEAVKKIDLFLQRSSRPAVLSNRINLFNVKIDFDRPLARQIRIINNRPVLMSLGE